MSTHTSWTFKVNSFSLYITYFNDFQRLQSLFLRNPNINPPRFANFLQYGSEDEKFSNFVSNIYVYL